jgi:hypothetical protein
MDGFLNSMDIALLLKFGQGKKIAVLVLNEKHYQNEDYENGFLMKY